MEKETRRCCLALSCLVFLSFPFPRLLSYSKKKKKKDEEMLFGIVWWVCACVYGDKWQNTKQTLSLPREGGTQ
jgi:hypothetical protein